MREYVKTVVIPQVEILKAQELVLKNFNKEVAFILLKKDTNKNWKTVSIDLIQELNQISHVNWWNWYEISTNEVSEITSTLKLHPAGEAHSHLQHHLDEFSWHDLARIDYMKNLWGNQVNLLFKINDNWRVNIQAINNLKEKVQINIIDTEWKILKIIDANFGDGGKIIPPHGFWNPYS